ncbi:MAG: hypothetical protein GY707_00460 [Desulfobacteraceae bacterium]|nr:hypothetical protein [Desulfobacteraceae bacterium]
MTSVDKQFIYKLIERGVEIPLIPGFVRSLANALLINPSMTHTQVNKRLKYLGWENIEIDYHTFQLAISSLETKGLSTLEYKPAPFYVDGYDMK